MNTCPNCGCRFAEAVLSEVETHARDLFPRDTPVVYGRGLPVTYLGYYEDDLHLVKDPKDGMQMLAMGGDLRAS